MATRASATTRRSLQWQKEFDCTQRCKSREEEEEKKKNERRRKVWVWVRGIVVGKSLVRRERWDLRERVWIRDFVLLLVGWVLYIWFFFPFYCFDHFFFTTILTTNVPPERAARFFFFVFFQQYRDIEILAIFFPINSLISLILIFFLNSKFFSSKKPLTSSRVFFFFFQFCDVESIVIFFPELEELLGFTLQKDKNFARFSQNLCLPQKTFKKKAHCQALGEISSCVLESTLHTCKILHDFH